MILQVETSNGASGTVEPTCFWLGKRRINVMEIIDRWPSADHIYFKIEADDRNTYILRHDENADQWEMTFFQAG
jgi:hypothetical protein